MKDRVIFLPFVDIDHHQGDEGLAHPDDGLLSVGTGGETADVIGVVSTGVGSRNQSANNLVHTRVFQQSVTLTASMWPGDAIGGNDTNAAASSTSWGLFWRVSSDRLPLLIAVFCAGALVVFLLITCIIYRCCIMPRKDKHYCIRKTAPEIGPTNCAANSSGMYPSNSAVFADPKSGQLTYSSRLVMGPAPPGSRQHWFYNNRIVGAGLQCTQCPGTCPVPRSSSHPGPNSNSHHQQINSNNNQRRQRPVSQPIRFGPCDLITNGEVQKKIPMPEISEFSPQNVQYASSSILDEVGIKVEDDKDAIGTTNLKTRSLPAWVRSKPRPLSTEDDLADLYAKVNFSKKRKNRMRNDEAAIIALSKSRSQFLHKDTDSLVDNEAVIVYDERTAL